MVVARMAAGAGSMLAMLSLSGCGLLWSCTDTTAERGEAGVRVDIVDTEERPVGVTAEVTGWRREPHPQVPQEGNQIHFDFRFEGDTLGSDPAVDACAVDDLAQLLKEKDKGLAAAFQRIAQHSSFFMRKVGAQ